MPRTPETERLEKILAQLDITTSALRDALRGTGAKSFTDIAAQLDITTSALRDALTGAAPNNTLKAIFTKLDSQLDALLSTRATETTLSALDTKHQSRTALVASELSVGTTEVQGPGKAVAPGKAIVIKASPANTDFVRIRQASGAANADSFRLGANDAITLYLDNFNRLFMIANSGTQIVNLIAEA